MAGPPRDPAMRALLERLPPPAPAQLAELVAVLTSDPSAPSAVRSVDEAWRVHTADSLSGLEVPPLTAARRIADLGSGAGLPGLVLAAALPEAVVDLIESVGRKCEFARRAIERTGIDRARVVCERAETWADAWADPPQTEGAAEGPAPGAEPENAEGPARHRPRGRFPSAGREAYDAVTARAVGRLSTLAELASPLLREGGVLVAWKGRRDPDEETELGRAAERLAMEPLEVRHVGPYAGSRHRHLHVVRKAGSTPPNLPRRPGMAKKRPFGAHRDKAYPDR